MTIFWRQNCPEWKFYQVLREFEDILWELPESAGPPILSDFKPHRHDGCSASKALTTTAQSNGWMERNTEEILFLDSVFAFGANTFISADLLLKIISCFSLLLQNPQFSFETLFLLLLLSYFSFCIITKPRDWWAPCWVSAHSRTNWQRLQ